MIQVRISAEGVPAAWVRGILAKTLKLEKSKMTLSAYLTDNRQIRRINKKFLNHDYATDVISFGLEKDFGELVVSVQMARQISRELALPFKEELARYLVHGTLHLLGYSDKKPVDRKKMHARQEKIITRIVKAK